MFSSMHELLDYIIQHYKEADAEEREVYCVHIQELKDVNDVFMDHWVSFEEKLALFFETYREHEAAVSQQTELMSNTTSQSEITASQSLVTNYVEQQPVQAIANGCDQFIPVEAHMMLEQAQGYYKLFMFSEAAELLTQILSSAPECNIARLYYGMTLMHLRSWSEAQRQFQLLLVLSEVPKWLALSYNALGCIHAIHMNMNQAEQLFTKAYAIYPQFEDSLKNLQSCQQTPQQLSLYFGSTELCCM